MVIEIKNFRLKREKEQTYRQNLVGQIRDFHSHLAEGERADNFYFEHIEANFSTNMLEDIIQKLQQKISHQG